MLHLFFEWLYCRPKPRRSGLSKECYRGFEHYSTCQVQFVGALVRVNMTWQLGNTRRRSRLLYRLMYAKICIFLASLLLRWKNFRALFFNICYPFSFFKVFINVHMFLKIYSHEKTRYLTGFVQHDFVILTIVYKF